MRTKLIIASLFSAILLISAGCKKDAAREAEDRITAAAEQLKLPVKLNDATTLTQCYYRDKILTFRNEASADSLASLNVDSLKVVTLERLKGGLFPQSLVKNIIDAKASIRYIYVCGNDSIIIPYSYQELAATK